MKVAYYFVLIFLILNGFVYNVKGDKIRYAGLNEEEKAKRFFKLALQYVDTYPDSTIFYGKKQKIIAENINDHNLLARAYFILGYGYARKKIYDVSAINYYKGLDVLLIVDNNHLNKIRRKEIYSGLGEVYGDTYNYELALKFYLKALQIAKDEGNDKHIALLRYNVGVIYEKMDDFGNAKEKYNVAISNFLELHDNYNLAKTYNSIGNVYLNEGGYDSARFYYLKALAISDAAESLENEHIYHLSNLGENYFKQKQYKQAKEQYLKALEASEKLNDTEKTRWVLNNVGDVLLKMENYSEAIQFYNRSIELKEGTKNVIDDELKRASRQIAIAYDAIGEYKRASEFKSQYLSQIEKIDEIKEDLQQQNARYRMKEVEWQRQIQEKERKIAGVEMENFWTKIIIGITLIVLIVAVYKIYIYSKKIAQVKMIIYSDEV